MVLQKVVSMIHNLTHNFPLKNLTIQLTYVQYFDRVRLPNSAFVSRRPFLELGEN